MSRNRSAPETAGKEEQFKDKIKKIYPANYEEVIHAVSSPPKISLRVNHLKASAETVLKSLKVQGFILVNGPLENSYIVEEPLPYKLSETQEFENGSIYIQSLSSMLSVIMLDPRPGEKVLDLCAAPGSKTTQISSVTGDRAEVTAVENNRQRFFSLKNNLETQGAKNVRVVLGNGVLLPKKDPSWLGYFDKVLVDAPCSNEGLVCLADPATLNRWNPKLAKKLPKLQRQLVMSGLDMLKVGGSLVYSTCTFSREENEELIDWVVARYPKIVVKEMKRVPPDGMFTGFFAARLLKTD